MTRPDNAEDIARLVAYADRLADGIEDALAPWVERSVHIVAERWQAGAGAPLRDGAVAAGAAAVAAIGPQVRSLLSADVSDQRTGPLAVVRGAVRFPTEVLAAAGVPPVGRDEFAVRAFPDDVYDLAPASFADLSPDLAGPGIEWGAAKAHVVMARHRTDPPS